MTEKERVVSCASTANYSDGVMDCAIKYCGKVFERYMNKGSVLEMGPAEGVMTDILYPKFSNDYTIVDGADFFVRDILNRHPQIKGNACLFEEFVPPKDKLYDNIVLGHVLEHVENPVEILRYCTRILAWGG